MNVLLCFMAIILACSAVSEHEARKEWEEFQVKFEKNYKTPVELQRRFSIFKENLEKFEAHNKLYAEGKVGHFLGVGPFADMTHEEFANRFGTNIEEIDDSEFTLYTPLNNTYDIPAAFDWKNIPNCVQRVKDQGQCSSCWAFAAAAALEAQYGLANHADVELSEQALVDCSNDYGNFGCNGGLATRAFSYVMNNGIPTAASYPYTAYDGTCQPFNSVMKIKSFMTIPSDESAMLDALWNQGPIAVSIDALGMIKDYSGGVLYDTQCTTSTNHAVLVTGFGTEKGQDFWNIKNSYGPHWGESGFLRLARGINNCGITKRPSVPVV
ncbi:procathepsin L-like [Coccinella septempunctata]|uniref:procathepsin L-like n=1 Tax=Coccinella septempunctata TaxID=41139 RepID=UPI001D08D8CC|nr:procathepsin L-like [Coccinella septempunctata]